MQYIHTCTLMLRCYYGSGSRQQLNSSVSIIVVIPTENHWTSWDGMAVLLGLVNMGLFHVHAYIHTHIHMYIHTYIHMYMCTYIHTYRAGNSNSNMLSKFV